MRWSPCGPAFAWLLLSLSGVGSARAEQPSSTLGLPIRPNIVLLTVDTVRADHTSSYGYDRKTTPVMDSMSANGLLFANAVSQASWTLPALASIHTGLYPTEHGAFRYTLSVSEQVTTVAEVLKRKNYATLSVVANGFAGRAHGLAQGFDFLDESLYLESPRRSTSKELVEIALAAVREYRGAALFPLGALLRPAL